MRPAPGSRIWHLGLAVLAVLALALAPFRQAIAASSQATPHVWLHYDYLVYPDGSNDAPNPAAIQMVVDVFAAHGIVLHVDNDHAAVPSAIQDVAMERTTECDYSVPGFPGVFHRQVVGIEDVKAQYFHPTANHEWHYALFGARAYPYCSSPVAYSGSAEINGENFVIGRQWIRSAQGTVRDVVQMEAGLFMHELGHNLGLRHGGFDDTNYKPNYLSVMNYSFQSGIPYTAAPGGPTLASWQGSLPIIGHRVDYSGTVLPPLDLAHLDEAAAIQAEATDVTNFCLDKFNDGLFWAVYAPASGPIDWNLDGAIDHDVAATIVDCELGDSLPRMLIGHDDWSAVQGYILGTIQRGPKTIAHEYAAEQPQITGISPASGLASGGTTVSITGVHLRKVSQVLFGTLPATSFTVVNEKTIVAVSPPRPAFAIGVVDVTVIAGDNPSPRVDVDRFFYTTVLPVVESVTPPAGPPGTEITITGSNFTGASDVRFVGAFQLFAEAFTVVDDRTIVARTPSLCCMLGPAAVRVANPYGTNLGGAQFTFLPPLPVVASLTPSSGPATGGTTVSVRGANFLGATAVRFGTVDALAFTVVDDANITAVAPPGAAGQLVHVLVSSPSGTSEAGRFSDQFYYATGAGPL